MSVWNGVEEFVMVARTSSFTAAARRLKVSTSHVSRRVQSLEDRLGVKLLARTTRAVKLTDLGRDLCVFLQRVHLRRQWSCRSFWSSLSKIRRLRSK